MESKLKSICIVVERNGQIEKIDCDIFRNIKASESAKVNKSYLEKQIFGWSYYDINDRFEEVFFKVYVQRYLNIAEIKNRISEYKSNELSALLVIRVNEEDGSDIKSNIDLSFHETEDLLNIELAMVKYMSFINLVERNSKRGYSFQLD